MDFGTWSATIELNKYMRLSAYKPSSPLIALAPQHIRGRVLSATPRRQIHTIDIEIVRADWEALGDTWLKIVRKQVSVADFTFNVTGWTVDAKTGNTHTRAEFVALLRVIR